jgi:hypothetical protein
MPSCPTPGPGTATSAPATTSGASAPRRRASSHVRSLERLGYKVTIEHLTPDAYPETGELITRTAS